MSKPERRHSVTGSGIRQALPLLMFIFAMVFAAFFYGYLAAVKKLPPYGLIHTAYDTVVDLAKYWKNDLNIEPTRHLVVSRPGRHAFATFHPDKLAPGYRLISGLTGGRKALNGALLYTPDGKEVHYWPVDYGILDPDGPDPENVMLHGIAVYRDGTIIVSFDEGRVLARIDACGKVIWNNRGWYHHAVSKSYDGTAWALNWVSDSDTLDQVNTDTGELIQRISLMQDIILPHRRQGLFLIKYPESEDKIITPVDPFHTNDIEILSPEIASAFPAFEAGDLLISLRQVNLVAVVGSSDHDLKWWSTGPWYRQHDPDFLPDGTISVLDNNMGFGVSRILAINPQTGEQATLFEGSELQPFYTWRRGQQEQLENGNLLITESEKGHVFEVDKSGELVWEYNNIYDEARNGIVTRAMVLPEDFFEAGALRCEP
jgi:outer membrane protein assembly factor BamB